jgi:tetratricopeptide (TPR) repeat protein
MALSRDFRQFNFPVARCYQTLSDLLPFMYVPIEPFTYTPLLIEYQNSVDAEIRARAQAGSWYYRYKFVCEALQTEEVGCIVRLEAATTGITDIGLGQLALRRILITLHLALIGQLPTGMLPMFMLQPPMPTPNSTQAQLQIQANQAFQLAKRGRADEALAGFQQYLTVSPTSSDIHFHNAVLYMVLDQLAEAEAAFQEVLKYEPNHILAQAYLDDVVERNKQKQKLATKPLDSSPLPAKNDSDLESMYAVAESDEDNVETTALVLNKAEQTLQVNANNAAENSENGYSAILYIHYYNGTHRIYTLTKSNTTIGRLETCDILLGDIKVSRHHAEINKQQYSISITDLGSANGTFYNGQRLTAHRSQNLEDGDIIKIGDSEFVFSRRRVEPTP